MSGISRTNRSSSSTAGAFFPTGKGAPAFFFSCRKPPSKSATPELIKLGDKTITSFVDGTKGSNLCASRYPALRNNLLRDHVWTFSKVFVSLSPLSAPSGVAPWLYKFTLPTDVARILVVSLDDQSVEFERIGTELHTTAPTIDLRYVRQFASTDDGFAFPDDFAEALSCLLAAEMAVSITQSGDLRGQYLQMYQERIGQAKFNGAVERYELSVQSSTWLDSHTGYTQLDIDPRLRGLTGY